MKSPDAIQEAADITAITQLILKERECRDTGSWDAMRDCFHPDSIVHISWFKGNGPDFVAGSIDMARRNILAKHRLSPIHVELNGNRAVATLSAIIDIPTKLDAAEMNLSSYARFVYRVERRSEGWKVYSFTAVYLRDELSPAVPGHTVTIDPQALHGYRRSYRLLSYVLSKQGGYKVDTELAGDDRPDLVQTLMREVRDWAGLKAA